MIDQRNREPEHRFNQALPETDAFASHPWRESKRIARLAIRGLEPFLVAFARVTEPFRLKDFGLWPLVRVLVHAGVED